MNASTNQSDTAESGLANAASFQSRLSIPHCPIPILVALVLGVVLRVAWLDSKPLWEDEAWTFVTAVSDSALTELVGLDPHPFSFYWICRQFPSWCFSTDWTFRLPHAVASCLALMLVPRLFRRWLAIDGVNATDDPSIDAMNRWCVLVFALLPLCVRYAQEARAYAFCQLAGVLVLLTYLECRRRPRLAAILALIVATTVSLHIDGFGWITPFVVGLHALSSVRRSESRRAIVGLVVGGLATIPYVLFRARHMLAAGEVHAVGSGRLGKAFAARWLELSPIGVAFDPVPFKYQYAIWIVAAIAAVVFFSGMASSVWKHKDDRRWLAVLLFIVPFSVLTALSLIKGEIFIFKKYLIPMAPAVALLFSLGVFRLTRGSWVSAVLVLLLVPLGVSVVSNVRAGDRADWRGLYAQMQPRIEADDVFIQQRHLNYPQYSFGPLRTYASRDGVMLDASRLFEYAADEEPVGAIRDVVSRSGATRVWTLTTAWMAKNEMADMGASGARIIELDARGCRAALWEIVDVTGDAGARSFNESSNSVP